MAAELQVRQLQPTDDEAFSSLQDQCFNVPPGQHYLNDFPVWNGKINSPPGGVFKLGAFEGERLVGAAAIRLAELHTGAAKLTIGLIGAVATGADFRGRGIASKLVSLLTEWASHRGVGLIALWGSEYELYQRIGFVPCGRQVRVPLSAMQNGSRSHSETEISSGFHEGLSEILFQKMKSRKTGLERTEIDFKWIQGHRNVKWYWSGPADSPLSFAAYGRGIDLGNLVHEWGGQAADLLPLLAHIHSLHNGAQILGSPETFGSVGIQFDPAAIEFLCLAHVIDPTAVFRAFVPIERVPHFNAQFSEGVWHMEMEDRFGKASRMTVDADELPRLFFGPKNATSTALKKPWSNYLPLPLWFWGLDAV